MWRPGTPRSLRQESCEGDTRPAAIARRHGTKSSQGGGLELQSGYALPPFQATASRLTLIDAQSHLDCRAAPGCAARCAARRRAASLGRTRLIGPGAELRLSTVIGGFEGRGSGVGACAPETARSCVLPLDQAGAVVVSAGEAKTGGRGSRTRWDEGWNCDGSGDGRGSD